MNIQHKHIILYDGVCCLCQGTVRLVIKYDKQNKFKFAALQSDIGQQLSGKYNLDPTSLDTMIYIQHNKTFQKSDGTLQVLKQLPYPVKMLSWFLIFPKTLRNWCYNFIGKHRYKWFGKTEQCLVPSDKDKERFID